MKRCLIGLVAAVAVLMMTCPSMAQQRRGRGAGDAGQPGGQPPRTAHRTTPRTAWWHVWNGQPGDGRDRCGW